MKCQVSTVWVVIGQTDTSVSSNLAYQLVSVSFSLHFQICPHQAELICRDQQSLPHPLVSQVIQSPLMPYGEIHFLRSLELQIIWRSYSTLILWAHGSLFIKKKAILRAHSFPQNKKQLVCRLKMGQPSPLQRLLLPDTASLPLQSPSFFSPPVLRRYRLRLLNRRWPPQLRLQRPSLLSLPQSLLHFWHMLWLPPKLTWL